jgi:prevent-host-death family protein
MKRAKVSDLKARLSGYLAEVRRGQIVEVCDRQTPVARIVPIERDATSLQVDEPLRPLSDLRRVKPIRLRRRIDVGRLLRESRDQR